MSNLLGQRWRRKSTQEEIRPYTLINIFRHRRRGSPQKNQKTTCHYEGEYVLTDI